MIRAKSALAGAGALVLAGALAAGVAHAAGPAAARPSTAHPARTTWVGSWGSVPTTVPPAGTTMFSNQTIRQTVHLSIGGSALQVRFSNEFGTAPLVIGEAHVGLAAGSQPSRSVAPGSDRRLSFAGHVSATVPAGAPLLSDPVRLAVRPGADLVVSLYLPRPTRATTTHAFAFQDNVVAAGNVTGSRTVTPTATFGQWWFLSGVSVAAPARDGAVVALGDSITDGANTTPNTNSRWPDVLARRLQATPGLRGLGVLNEGISGNRLLHDPNPLPGSGADAFAAQFGESALRRFDRDVSSQPGARYVIVLLGVNDLGHPARSHRSRSGSPRPTSSPATSRSSTARTSRACSSSAARSPRSRTTRSASTRRRTGPPGWSSTAGSGPAARTTGWSTSTPRCATRPTRSGSGPSSTAATTCTRTTRERRRWRTRCRCGCSAEESVGGGPRCRRAADRASLGRQRAREQG